jgi:hypothetical protein
LTDLCEKFGVAKNEVWQAVPAQFMVQRKMIRHAASRGGANVDLNNPPEHLRNLSAPDDDTRWFLGPERHSPAEDLSVAVYASDTDLHRLAATSTWIVDATFSTAPKGYMQMMVVHVKVCSMWYYLNHIHRIDCNLDTSEHAVPFLTHRETKHLMQIEYETCAW